MFKRYNPTSKIINDYKSCNFPYTSDPKNYRHKLEGLMSELAELHPVSFTLADNKYFNSFGYLYLDPRYPGNFEYVGPSGKIYKLNYKPFYAGKGNRHRFNIHLWHAKDTRMDNLKVRIIKKIWEADLEPIILVASSRVSNLMSAAFEIDMIAAMGRRDKGLGPLANHTDGGEGTSGHVTTKEHRLNLSKALKGHKKPPRSAEHSSRISKSLSGKICPKGSAAKKGVPWSAARRAAHNARTSAQWKLTGERISKGNTKYPKN